MSVIFYVSSNPCNHKDNSQGQDIYAFYLVCVTNETKQLLHDSSPQLFVFRVCKCKQCMQLEVLFWFDSGIEDMLFFVLHW